MAGWSDPERPDRARRKRRLEYQDKHHKREQSLRKYRFGGRKNKGKS